MDKVCLILRVSASGQVIRLRYQRDVVRIYASVTNARNIQPEKQHLSKNTGSGASNYFRLVPLCCIRMKGLHSMSLSSPLTPQRAQSGTRPFVRPVSVGGSVIDQLLPHLSAGCFGASLLLYKWRESIHSSHTEPAEVRGARRASAGCVERLEFRLWFISFATDLNQRFPFSRAETRTQPPAATLLLFVIYLFISFIVFFFPEPSLLQDESCYSSPPPGLLLQQQQPALPALSDQAELQHRPVQDGGGGSLLLAVRHERLLQPAEAAGAHHSAG